MRTDALGSSDQEVITRAISEGRILTTFDKNFGELVFRTGLSVSSGVILFRMTPALEGRDVKRLELLILESTHRRYQCSSYDAAYVALAMTRTVVP